MPTQDVFPRILIPLFPHDSAFSGCALEKIEHGKKVLLNILKLRISFLT